MHLHFGGASNCLKSVFLIKALPLKPLPSPYSAKPSRGGNVAKAFIKIIRLRNCIYRGLGRCPSSQYAFSLAHAYSARLRFYGHVLLIPKKSSIFREPYPLRRLYLCNRDSHHSKLIFRRGRLPRRPVAKLCILKLNGISTQITFQPNCF